jgi:hypothetical protein
LSNPSPSRATGLKSLRSAAGLLTVHGAPYHHRAGTYLNGVHMSDAQPQPQPQPPYAVSPPYARAGGQPHPFPDGPRPIPPAPPRKRRTGRILVLVLAVLLVLCGGGVGVVYLAARDEIDSFLSATGTRVVAPDTLGGRAKLVDGQMAAAAAEAATGLRTSMRGVTATVGGAYGDPAKKDVVMVVAGARRTARPGAALEEFVRGLTDGVTDSGGSMQATAPIDPGPLGGFAECGAATMAEVPTAVCAWVDYGSFGAIYLYWRTVEDVIGEFPAIRAAVELPC